MQERVYLTSRVPPPIPFSMATRGTADGGGNGGGAIPKQSSSFKSARACSGVTLAENSPSAAHFKLWIASSSVLTSEIPPLRAAGP